MNSNNTINHNKDRTKTTAAIPMVGAIVTAALLLSGLSLISSSYQPATAQQLGMTTDGGGGGGATTGGGTEGGATGGATPQDGNATAAGGAGGGDDSLSRIRMHLESARTALQNNDTQGAMLYLELADNALGGAGALQGSNMTAAGTTTGGATNMTTTGGNQTAAAGGSNQTAAAGGVGGQLEGIFGGGGGD
jgi:hypothetical protein